jgi:DNA ligase 1
LKGSIRRQSGRLLYLDHIEERGCAFYEAVCRMDLEGIVAKRKDSRYVGTRSRSWLKVKNPTYSQAEGRRELFDGWKWAHPGPGVVRLGL